jgi:hypothetical protein
LLADFSDEPLRPLAQLVRILPRRWHESTLPWNQTSHQTGDGSVGRRTPDQAWHAHPRAIPARQGIRIDEQFRVRKDRVDTDGKLTLRHGSRLHHIGIGRAWAGTRVLMLAHELDIRIITEDSELTRQLTLDPTRDYQPQAPRV